MRSPHDYPIANTPLPVWSRVQSIDAGWLYMILSKRSLKIGKTTNPVKRLQEARTWLPNATVVGVKPFWEIHRLERVLHSGLANYWAGGEWHEPSDEILGHIVDGFRNFGDHDRNNNSVEFSYWISGSGMGELVIEQNRRRMSLRAWQRESTL